MMKQNFSVKAILRTDKKRLDGTCPVNYRVTIDSKTLKLSSGEYVQESNWNKKDSCFKGSKSSVGNSLLDNDISRIKDYLREQRSIGKYLTTECVKNFFSNKSTDDFFEFFDEFCERKFMEIGKGTQKHYLLLKKRLKEYKTNIKLQQIDLKFIENFDSFLRKRSVISDAGMFNRHKNLKAVIRYAIKRKLMQYNPYEDFKSPKCKEKFGHLTINEIATIKELCLEGHRNKRGLNFTIDMFLFSCYTGLRCSDVQNLKWQNVIDSEYLALTTIKTQKKVNIPLSELALRILKKYESNDDNIFPFRTNECLNRNLKKIAEMCEIDKVITFHMGRHTFATILANDNVNPFHISQMMSHSSMKQTMTYVNSGVEALKNSVNQIRAFK